MKKVIKIVIIAVVMLGSFVGNAQESQNKKETNIVGITLPTNSTDMIVSNTSQKIHKLTPNQYGEIHNQILESFYSSGKKVSDYNSNEDLIDEIVKITLKLYPNFEKYPNFYNGINDIKSSFKYDKKNKESIFDNLRDNLWRMTNSKKNVDLRNITSNFIEVRQLNKVNKTYPNLNTFEKELIERFNSVLNNSKSYWTKKYKTAPKDNGVIFADAVGALIFWETGPGSIIAGAAFSMIVNSNT